MKEKISIFLVFCLLTSLSLLSCGEENETVQTPSNSENTVMETEEGVVDDGNRENARDGLPAGLKFNGETVQMIHRQNFAEDLNGDNSGDVFASAVHNRNLAVEERLNVDVVYYTADDDSPSSIVQNILSNDDSMDVVLHTEWKMVGLITQGAFLDVTNVKYLDLERSWWLPNVTRELNVAKEKTILFTGEMLPQNIGSISAMYVNVKTFTDVFGDINVLHDTVLEGGWTYDVFDKYVEDSYRDLNGDGLAGADDSYGFVSDYSSCVDNLTFSTDVSFYTRAEDGYPVLNINTDRTLQLVEKMYYLLYENVGTYISLETDLVPYFVADRSMFMGYRLNTATLAEMRDMTSDFSIIPYPKLDEKQQEYVSLIHNSSPVIAVPISCIKQELVYAVLEALSSESYRSVTPAYYDKALKGKYVRDDISGQMIDLIYKGARKELIYDMNPGKAGQITRQLMEKGNTNLASFYATNAVLFETALTDLVDSYRKLKN